MVVWRRCDWDGDEESLEQDAGKVFIDGEAALAKDQGARNDLFANLRNSQSLPLLRWSNCTRGLGSHVHDPFLAFYTLTH